MMIRYNPKISVIIPVYLAYETLRRTLESLVNQTLSYDKFEVIIIFNGPEDGSRAVATDVSEHNPNISIRYFSSDPASAPAARNVGILEAKGDFVAFIDADDWVSEHYLELLLQHSSDQTVPVSQIVDVYSNGRHDYWSRYNTLILNHRDPSPDPKSFFTPLSFMASKMYPLEWVKNTLFDETLRSSEDVEFNYRLFSNYDFRFSLFPAAAGATYFRGYSETSISRGNISRDFLVDQRIHMMRILEDLRKGAPSRKRSVFLPPLRAQLNFVAKYINNISFTEKQEILDAIVGLGIRGLNWTPIQDDVERLVIALNFSPYADTGAIVTSKRIRQVGKTVDVISGDLSRLREKHSNNSLISSPYVRRHKVLQSPIKSFGSKLEVLRFIEMGLEAYEELENVSSYSELYSRSMWPHSHFLAAAIKRRRPHLHWEAEFSDPNSLTVEGKERPHPPVSDEIYNHFVGWGTTKQQQILNSSRYVMRWAELLPYFFADSLTFTNKNQLNIMLEHAPEEFRSEIYSKSKVRAHPTLPKQFYGITRPPYIPDSGHINLAYFGDFYTTRGMTEIFQGLAALTDDERDRIRIFIFTASDAAKVHEFIPEPVQDAVEVRGKLEYLEFLSTLNFYDILIVNDANTQEFFSLNPYLPSKASDYIGCDTPIWAVVERGSILSSMVFSYESELGDIDGAKRVLRRILNTQPNFRSSV